MTTPASIPSPGLHLDVPFRDYLRWPILSQSVLKEGRESMAHLKAALDAERVKKPTDDMLLGSALHVCFLEPERMPDRVALWDRGSRRGAEWEAFSRDNADKVILTEGYYEKLVGMVRSLRRHPVVRDWVRRMEAVEVSAVGDIRGVTMKGRADALTTDPLIDLKKVSCGDPARFGWTARDFGYHIQAVVYRHLFSRERFVLITVEDSPPYDVVPFELSERALRRGERELEGLLADYAACQATGVWPGRSPGNDPVELDVPGGDDDSEEITIGGETAFGGGD